MTLVESIFMVGDNEWQIYFGSNYKVELYLNEDVLYISDDGQPSKDMAKERLLEMPKEDLAAIILGITDNAKFDVYNMAELLH